MEARTSGVGRRLIERGPAILVIVLLAMTAAAFVRAEQQKLQRSPVVVVNVDELFSPVCRCPTSSAEIVLRLRGRSRVTLEIVDRDERVVRTLIANRRERGRVAVSWDGRDDARRLVGDGVYRPRLRLAAADRTFLLANPIKVDTQGPRATLISAEPQIFTVNGDGRSERVSVRYRLSERAQPLLLVNGRVRVRGQRRIEGKLDWYGNRATGKRARPRRYHLQVAALDEAGNLGPLSPAVVVRVRRP